MQREIDQSHVPGSTHPDIAGRRQLDRSGSAVVPSVPGGALADADPRTERGVHAKSGSLSTPGMVGQARERDVASDVGGDEEGHLFSGTRPFPAWTIEGSQSAALREDAARPVQSRVNAVRGRSDLRNGTTRLTMAMTARPASSSLGIPPREYARAIVSGIKPPPPAVAAGTPPPPVVSR